MLRQITVIAAVSLGLTACALLPDHSLDYRDAKVLKPMTVPDGMVFLGAQGLYQVPNRQERLTGPLDGEDSFEAPRPPQLVKTGDDGEPGTPEAVTPPPPGTDTTPILAKDGSGYPIIMMPVSYAWAWEKVGQALTQTDLRVTDRNRDQGLFYLTVPERYRLSPPQARLKLSHTTNGIQVTVLGGNEGMELAPKDSGLAILEQVHAKLLANARQLSAPSVPSAARP